MLRRSACCRHDPVLLVQVAISVPSAQPGRGIADGRLDSVSLERGHGFVGCSELPAGLGRPSLTVDSLMIVRHGQVVAGRTTPIDSRQFSVYSATRA